MKYDLEAMNFNVEDARAGALRTAFIWEKTPEGSRFWVDALCGEVPREEWQPKLDAMIAQWEEENEMRDPDIPKLWGDMTPEEKGALLLADHEGKVIEIFHNDEWQELGSMIWHDWQAYRVRPEPEQVTLCSEDGKTWRKLKTPHDNYRITLDLIDGKPDPSSINMEEL